MATQFSVDQKRAWKRPFFTIWILQALSLLGSADTYGEAQVIS
jgi:hypothetical protein